MKQKKIKIPIYNINFTIVLYKDTKELQKLFTEIGYQCQIGIASFDAAILTHKGEYYFLIEEKEKISPGVIAHEAKHLVNFIFKDIHHELDRHNDEPECYLLEYIVDQIHENI